MKINDPTELITNGHFDTDLNGWTATGGGSGNPGINNGYAVLPNLSSISQKATIAGGSTYSLSYNMGLFNGATGYITVVSNPSNKTLFTDTATGKQTAISLTVTESGDTGITITFDCTRGGEIHVDDVSLVLSDKAFIVGGDFSDANLPGWVQTGNSSGALPAVVDGHLKLPAGTSVYQDIVIEDVRQLELTYSMTVSDGAAGTFSVISQPSSKTLYTDSTGVADRTIFFCLAQGDTIARLQFTCSSGSEVDVDNVAMDYASSVVITEQQSDNGHYPWIFPGQQGDLTFDVQPNNPDHIGSRIHFTAPTGTTLVNATIPGQEGCCEFKASEDYTTGNLTLTTDGITWTTCTLTLAVGSQTKSFTTMADGKAQYYIPGDPDDQQVGDPATITVITASNNVWDNVRDVEKCLIAMGTDDVSYDTSGTLFMNGCNIYDETASGDVFKAHSIPVFVGITFGLENADYPGPSKEDVKTAFLLVNDGGTTVQGYITTAPYTDFLQAYNNSPLSGSVIPESGVYEIELDSFPIWCSKSHDDTTGVPLPINLCIQLRAPRTGGDYVFTSNTSPSSILAINFVATKTYVYSENEGSSEYILVNKETASDKLWYDDFNEARKNAYPGYYIFRVAIDKTLAYSKYKFSFYYQVGMNFDKVTPDSDDYPTGNTVDSVWISGVGIGGEPQWNYYAQHLLLPTFSDIGFKDLSTSYSVSDNAFVGYTAAHEADGWATSGKLEGEGSGFTVNAGEIAFAGFKIEYANTTDNVLFANNNELDSDGNSRIHLVDNFGNHVYMTPTFSASMSDGSPAPNSGIRISDDAVTSGNMDMNMVVTVTKK
jgi:hypothetical protein